ncbi:MAG: minor capsid protein [Cyanobacteria bacterium P01_D01_bin.115]
MVAGTDILSIVDRIDRAANRIEAAEVARLHGILDQSFKALEAELRRTYPELQSIGGLVAAQRKTIVLEKLGRALDLIDPDQTDAYRGQFRDLMTLSNDLGGALSEQLLTAYGETNLEPFTGINIEAIANLASESVKRLHRYSDDFKEKTTALIGMGLIQGWGAGRLIPEMRRQLGLAKGKAETLVRTEVMGVLNQGAIARYEQNGIEYSQWWNSPSEGLCGRCAVRNGRVYRNKDIVYPLHPRDRCYLSPWKPEWQADGITDDSFAEQYRQQGFAQLEANGLTPDYSPSGFEKNAGLTAAPKAAWSPGDKPLTPSPAASPEPAPPATPKRPRKPREFPTKAQLGKLEVIRSLGGSTGAELVRDPKLDKLFVRKRGNSAAHLRDEFAADAIYRAMGANVPKAKLYETDQGPVKLAEFVQGRPLSDLTLSEKQSVHKQLQDGFAGDALLGNWDVIGLSQDNILVDADGKPWRIDNGGALRFRAQGARKQGGQWNDYPTELWSLRSAQVNTQAAEVFGGLPHFDMVQQIEQLQSDRKAILKAVPKDLKATVERRLDEMVRVATLSRTLEQDEWKEDYISRFTKHSLGLRNAGIVDKLPQRLDLAQNNQVYDESGKLFDNLRGQGSIVADVERYINGNGGSYDAIAGWAGQQAGSSWSNASQTLKWELAQSRNAPLDRYFWRDGTDGAKQSWEQGMKMIGADTYRESLAAFHAWNYELLQAVEMPNNDRKNNIFRAVRTENRYVMDTINKLSPGDRGVVIQRGAAESTSMFTKVSVYGSEVTVQNIPHHRVLGMYLQSRRSSGGSMFLSDGENELVALLEGIEMDYLKPRSWRNAKPNYSP